MQSGNALGEYLRARRELVSPESAGIPHIGRRRVPGLRRDELSLLAGVSTDYYVRLEQGRDRHPSAQVLDALAVADSRFQVELVDLAELALPLLDEPDHPALRNYTTEHARAWSATVDSADAVVLVTAEYNWGYPAPLKNALDYLCHEWANKPVGFVSYGGIAAGTRSVQQLRQVTSALRMVTAVNAVHIPLVFSRLDGDARLISDSEMQDAARTMLEELEALDQTLAPTRERLAG